MFVFNHSDEKIQRTRMEIFSPKNKFLRVYVFFALEIIFILKLNAEYIHPVIECTNNFRTSIQSEIY